MKISPSNTISSVISSNSSSTGQSASPHSNCPSLTSIWLRLLSRVIRKKWFLTLILSMSAIYCIISFTPSISRRRDNVNTFYLKKYMGARVHTSDHFIIEPTVDYPDQQVNSKLLYDHISSHELLAIPAENSKANSLEELNSGQDLIAPTSTSAAATASGRMNPIVFGSKVKLKSKMTSSTPSTSDSAIKIKRCRNSVQGRLLLADDQGYVCHRQFLTKGGCCNSSSLSSSVNSLSPQTHSSPSHATPMSANQITRYSCNTCNSDGCCAIYEYCISCCMNPETINVRSSEPVDGDGRLLASPDSPVSSLSSVAAVDTDAHGESHEDPFEFCLAKCRTSSSSVKHENSYRDARFKHCHGHAVALSDNGTKIKG